jgi:hypothetical protein
LLCVKLSSSQKMKGQNYNRLRLPLCGEQSNFWAGRSILSIRRMAESFFSCPFRHVHRQLNAAAHSLPKFSDVSFSSVWRCALYCIHEIIYNGIIVKWSIKPMFQLKKSFNMQMWMNKTEISDKFVHLTCIILILCLHTTSVQTRYF